MQERRHFKTSLKQRISLRYLLHLPAGYAESKARWPLILFLHGVGESGADLSKVAHHGPPKLVSKAPRSRKGETEEQKAARLEAVKLLKEKFIVVSPQCAIGVGWDSGALSALLDDVEKRLRADRKRIYLTGISMGGYGVWDLGLREPGRFAAMAPICGGASTLQAKLNSRNAKRKAIQNRLPIWVFHGAKDSGVRPEESKRMVKLLRKYGNKSIKLTVYPEAGHDSWTESYANPELYRWFLKHSLK